MKKEHKELLDSFWGIDLFAELREENYIGYKFTYKTDNMKKLVNITIDVYTKDFTIKDLITELKQHKDLQNYTINTIKLHPHWKTIEKAK